MRFLSLIVMTQLFLFSSVSAENLPENGRGDNEGNMRSKQVSVISVNAIRIPVGYFVLVRDGDNYGALRFTEMKKLTNYEAEGGYEAYCQEDGSGDFSKKNVKHRHRTLSQKQPLPIIGRVSIMRGNINILCGPFAVPTTGTADAGWMYFRDNSLMEPGPGVWLAPTAITDISKVNVFDGRLKWYRHDDSRKDFELDLTDLLNGN